MALVLLILYPFAVGGLAAHLCESRLSAKLGRAVTVAHGRGGFGRIVLEDVTIPERPAGRRWRRLHASRFRSAPPSVCTARLR